MKLGFDRLTRIDKVDGYFFKRDDLFRPLAYLKVNGGKFRQCLELVQKYAPKGIVTYSSMYSPQLGIVPAVGQYFGIPVKYIVGGQKETEYIKLARELGAHVVREMPARDTYLFSIAKKLATPDHMVIKSGILSPGMISDQVNITARQVRNIPEQIRQLVVTCGSGLTAIGIVKGIQAYRKSIKHLSLVATAPDRSRFIAAELLRQNVSIPSLKIHHYSIYDQHGYNYKNKRPFSIGKLMLHPQYEAKAFYWFLENVSFKRETTLFWIVGSEIL